MSSLPPARPALTARILYRLRPGVTEKFLVQPSEALVGREPGLAVTVPVDGVSRRHARITFDGKSYWIENLSPAGTFLNGTLVVWERLAHLDVITLGKKVDLVFLLRPEEEGATTTEGIVRAALVPEEGADAAPYEIAPGEILIGRSSANNVVAESSGAVSKVHARIERTPQQLVLRDLGSSNGTFVNGERVMTALLRDGDVIGLANVVSYRVIVERGQVVATPGSGRPAEAPFPVVDDRGDFSPEWKTRYDWDSSEIRGIAAMQARLIAEDGERMRARAKKEGAPVPTDKRPTTPTPKLKVPGQTPAKPAAPKVSRSAATAAVPVVPVEPRPAAPPEPAAPRPAPPAPPPPAAPEPGAPAPVARPDITELRLVGPAGELAVTQPGEYVLGRAKDAPLRVDNPTVSRRHALVVMTADREFFLENTGGVNGTNLNGVNVDARTPLRDGDRVGIGDVELLVRLLAAEPPRPGT
jgi:pSer/pThr/pTyr-binding forkhead associated (FHA) protein